MTPDTIVSEIAKFVIRAVGTYLASRPRLRGAKHLDHELAVATAAQDAIGWASNIQILGMPRPKNSLNDAVPLRIVANHRRYRSQSESSELTEADLSNATENILLLGDPGSGKTTTLKRLTQQLILGESSEDNLAILPLVVRLRDLAEGESLVAAIARRLGLAVTRRQALQIEDEWNPNRSNPRPTTAEYWIGDIRAQEAILGFFSEQRAFLAIDGLDEYSGDRQLLLKDVNQLATSSPRLRIVMTARVGDYLGGLVGFDVYQICPLSDAETIEIARSHLANPGAFLRTVHEAPYKDLADRPLFLMQLILIFRQYGSLPHQPTEVYPIVVDLVLRDWDVDQNVARKSRYSGFTPSKKAKFLSSLAYQLLIKSRARVFTSRDLEYSYESIRERFDLPGNEAKQVAQEIESHSGLIVAASLGRFEFCHLSIQEYLAADYMSRETRGSNLRAYMKEYPATVAVAVVLSSDPGDTFASLVFDGLLERRETSLAFVARLVVERPVFGVSKVFGGAVIQFLANHLDALARMTILTEFLELKGVKESASKGLADYVAHGTGMQLVLVRAASSKTLANVLAPDKIPISLSVLHEIMGRTGGMPTAFLIAPA